VGKAPLRACPEEPEEIEGVNSEPSGIDFGVTPGIYGGGSKG